MPPVIVDRPPGAIACGWQPMIPRFLNAPQNYDISANMQRDPAALWQSAPRGWPEMHLSRYAAVAEGHVNIVATRRRLPRAGIA